MITPYVIFILFIYGISLSQQSEFEVYIAQLSPKATRHSLVVDKNSMTEWEFDILPVQHLTMNDYEWMILPRCKEKDTTECTLKQITLLETCDIGDPDCASNKRNDLPRELYMSSKHDQVKHFFASPQSYIVFRVEYSLRYRAQASFLSGTELRTGLMRTESNDGSFI